MKIADFSIADCGLRTADCRSPLDAGRGPRQSAAARRRVRLFFNPQPATRNPQSKGFTLLELMIVISIIIVLAVIILPQYQRVVQQSREAVLRDDLFQMRKMIDQYAADKGKLPQTLDDLVTDGYLREVPVDPMTGAKDWCLHSPFDDPGTCSDNTDAGLFDVTSKSEGTALDGSKYKDW